MNFKELNISYNDNNYKIINFNDKEIKIFTDLPIEDKFSIIMSAIQKSTLNGIINPIRYECFYWLNIIYLATDIEFDIEDRINEGALYDCLKQNGFIDAVQNTMDPNELAHMASLSALAIERTEKYQCTAAAIISKLVDDLPKNVDAAKDIVENFDQAKFTEVLNFVKAIKNQ